MRKKLFEWDELNLIREEAERVMALPQEEKQNPEVREKFCDYLEFVLCLVYAYGWHDAEEIVGVVPYRDDLADKTVNLEIANKTWRERVVEVIESGSNEEMQRIIETESTRDYNTGVTDAGVESNVPGITKTWNTMLDDRVRDQHMELEGQTVGIDDLFYIGADSAYAPGGFSLPENNINCRCWLTLGL